jgi:hypothetical protein
MRLTKKEITGQIKSIPSSRVFFERKYEGTIRGFFFESDKDDLYETDEAGRMTFVDKITRGKRGVVTSIYNWFKQYASQELD